MVSLHCLHILTFSLISLPFLIFGFKEHKVICHDGSEYVVENYSENQSYDYLCPKVEGLYNLTLPSDVRVPVNPPSFGTHR